MTHPVRYVIRQEKTWEAPTRGGQPIYGGKSREITREVRVLQYWDENEYAWKDVPEVRER